MPKYAPPRRTKPKKFKSEENMHFNVVQFLKRDYPGTIFFTDFAAGLFLPPWLAVKRKQLQSGKGFPDIMILSPQQGYHALALELKKDGARLKLKNGRWADDRIAQQNKVLEQLEDLGYAAYFAVGLEQAQAIIDWYFGKAPIFNTAGRVPLIAKPEQPNADKVEF